MIDIMAKPTGKCLSCNERDATVWWAGDGGLHALTHGEIVPWCERCCVAVQLAHARATALRIPALEERLRTLGGNGE